MNRGDLDSLGNWPEGSFLIGITISVQLNWIWGVKMWNLKIHITVKQVQNIVESVRFQEYNYGVVC